MDMCDQTLGIVELQQQCGTWLISPHVLSYIGIFAIHEHLPQYTQDHIYTLTQ